MFALRYVRATSHPRVIGNVTVPATNKTVLAKHTTNPLADSKEPQSHTKGGFQREFAASCHETWYLHVVGERHAKLGKVFAMAAHILRAHNPTNLSPRSASGHMDTCHQDQRHLSRIAQILWIVPTPIPRGYRSRFFLFTSPLRVYFFLLPPTFTFFLPLSKFTVFLLSRMFTVFSSPRMFTVFSPPSDRPHL